MEPVTNPGFLYQQSTVRDALVAAVTLNIFNKHCDRVKLACIAQMVNVLQAVILTDGERMLKTPTYHVMHMYRHHQGAELCASDLTDVDTVGADGWDVPQITESVSEKDGVLTITLGNLSATEDKDLTIGFAENEGKKVIEARIVTNSDYHAYNTFDEPSIVNEEEFTRIKWENGHLMVTLPKASVVELRVR